MVEGCLGKQWADGTQIPLCPTMIGLSADLWLSYPLMLLHRALATACTFGVYSELGSHEFYFRKCTRL